MIWTIPNILTMGRILAAPCVALVFVVFERPLADWLAFGLFVGAALTDFLDGWLARRLGQISEIGKMLDSIADKVLVIVALMVLVAMTSKPGPSLDPLIAIPAVVIASREVLISGVREFLGDVKLPVTQIAKWKTTVQMLAIGGYLLIGALNEHRLMVGGKNPFADIELKMVCLALLLVATLLTILSGIDYFRKGLAHIRAREGM